MSVPISDKKNKTIEDVLAYLERIDKDNIERYNELEKKINSLVKNKDHLNKEKINPFSQEYFFKQLFTRKYLVDLFWKFITKSFLFAFLEMFIWSQWLWLIREVNRHFWGGGWKHS